MWVNPFTPVPTRRIQAIVAEPAGAGAERLPELAARAPVMPDRLPAEFAARGKIPPP
jgi:hypothetical protein